MYDRIKHCLKFRAYIVKINKLKDLRQIKTEIFTSLLIKSHFSYASTSRISWIDGNSFIAHEHLNRRGWILNSLKNLKGKETDVFALN